MVHKVLGTLGIPCLSAPFGVIELYAIGAYEAYESVLQSVSGQDFVARLVADPRVAALRNARLYNGLGTATFQVDQLARWYFWLTNDFGRDEAEQQLENFLNADEIGVTFTDWLLGVNIPESMDVGNGVCLRPIGDLPASATKRSFEDSALQFPLYVPPPKAALTIRTLVPKSEGDPLHERTESCRTLMYQTALLMNALDNVWCVSYWQNAELDPKTPFGPFSPSGGGRPMRDVTGWGSDTMLKRTVVDQLGQLIECFNRLPEPHQDKLRQALERLSQAKRRQQVEDKVLDLGIAAEMLLMDGDSKGDVALSFRLRGAWLLGESQSERREIFDRLKEFYGYRSDVAHTGVLGRGKAQKVERARDSLPTCQNYVERICRRLIEGGVPDWDNLVLGHPS